MKASSTGTSRIVIFAAAAVFLVASSVFSLVLTGGTPVVPETFYGTLTINGNPAPVGTQMKGLVGAEDRTDSPPYTTSVEGQYGSETFIGKFGVLCDAGEQITFAIEKSPGSGQFQDVAGPLCNPGQQNVNLDIVMEFSETCTNGDTRPCPLQQGVCSGSQETCTGGQWPGCTTANYGPYYEAQEASCDNKDNDCNGQVDEGLTRACGSGQCVGTQTCSTGSWGSCSTSGSDCGVCASCDASGSCAYDETQDSDCNGNDIAGIATCTNTPDANSFTWDSRAAFDSQCAGLGTCSTGSSDISHACSKASCQAPCETDGDCNDLDPNTIDMCLADCTCQNTYLPSCGNDQIDQGETCELPDTSDNSYCPQTTSQCSGTKLGVRDTFGYCNIVCGCTEDSFTYSCVAGECGAECSYDSDCNDGNDSTVDTCLNDCMCQYTPQTEYCLLITSMRVLNSMQDEDYTIPAGTMYYIEMSTFNGCDNDMGSMQIVQILKGSMPVNLGSVESTIDGAETSVVTVGFIMPNGTPPGTGFTANGFNWNHWIDQNPQTFEILSVTGQVSFQSE